MRVMSTFLTWSGDPSEIITRVIQNRQQCLTHHRWRLSCGRRHRLMGQSDNSPYQIIKAHMQCLTKRLRWPDGKRWHWMIGLFNGRSLCESVSLPDVACSRVADDCKTIFYGRQLYRFTIESVVTINILQIKFQRPRRSSIMYWSRRQPYARDQPIWSQVTLCHLYSAPLRSGRKLL